MTEVLNRKVLVLNSGWVPIDVTSVWDAICKAYSDRARFVDPNAYVTYDFEEWVDTWADAIEHAQISVPVVSSERIHVRVPEVMVATEYNGMAVGKGRNRPKFSRRNIYLRDKNTCQYCGKKFRTDELNLDHVIPRAQGGEMSWTNIVLSCIPCNDKKRDRRPEQAGMVLVRKPYVPKSSELKRPYGERLKRKLGSNPPATWEHFLGDMYWEVALKD